jgi:hypothetical protein
MDDDGVLAVIDLMVHLLLFIGFVVLATAPVWVLPLILWRASH